MNSSSRRPLLATPTQPITSCAGELFFGQQAVQWQEMSLRVHTYISTVRDLADEIAIQGGLYGGHIMCHGGACKVV